MARYLSTREAAELVKMTPAGFRNLAARARRAGVELHAPEDTWPDRRTPMWDRRAIERYRAGQPGSGRWGPRED